MEKYTYDPIYNFTYLCYLWKSGEAMTEKEQRFFCIGRVGGRILTVRFVYRENAVRIFGAGYWRKGREYYEKEGE